MNRPPAPLLFLLPALALMPFGRLVEAPLLCLAIIGLTVTLSGRLRREQLRMPLLLFATFLLPMLLALPDAVNADKALITSIGALRYLFATLGLLWLFAQAPSPEVARERTLNLLGAGCALLVAVWSIDGLWQFFSGRNVLGYGMRDGYINGLFGDGENLKFGITLALLLPIALVHAVRRWPPWSAAGFLLLALTLLVLSGKRAAWIVALVELGLLTGYYGCRGRLLARHVLAAAVLLVAAATLAYQGSDWVRYRTDVLWTAAQQRDYQSLNEASGYRLPIWSAALRIAGDHWINGVGPRGFRYVYRDYADEGDRWAARLATGGARASHSHQLLLELLCETGVFGLAGYAGLILLLLRCWARAAAAARARALPFALCLAGMLFPLNTHPAWYSSWSGLMLWLFIGLYLYALAEAPETGARL